jgi:hypothetical protein
MIEIYHSLIHNLFYLPDKHLLKQVFTEKSKSMNWPQYQHELVKTTEFLNKYHPSLLLVDARNFDFVILKEMQGWIQENVISVLNEVGVQKWAVISTPEFVSQVSIEQTIESKRNNIFQAEYFDSEDEAMRWLLNNQLSS